MSGADARAAAARRTHGQAACRALFAVIEDQEAHLYAFASRRVGRAGRIVERGMRGEAGEDEFACAEEIANARATMTEELERLEALRKRAPVLPRVALLPEPGPALIQ